jgi:hypothetical protein
MMDDDASLNWELKSSEVRSGPMLPVPEVFRGIVSLDQGDDLATWWGIDMENGLFFLSDGYTQTERFVIFINRTYKLHSGSRVKVPNPKNSERVNNEEEPLFEEGDTIYFYTDDRMKDSDPRSVIIFDELQFDMFIMGDGRPPVLADEVPVEEGGSGESSEDNESEDDLESLAKEAHESPSEVFAERLGVPK